MQKTKSIIVLALITLGLGLQAQEGGADEKSKPIYKAPSGKAYPAHWGAPPRLQTFDLRVLPGGYGRGSGTLARWIQQNLDKDAKKEIDKDFPIHNSYFTDHIFIPHLRQLREHGKKDTRYNLTQEY